MSIRKPIYKFHRRLQGFDEADPPTQEQFERISTKLEIRLPETFSPEKCQAAAELALNEASPVPEEVVENESTRPSTN